LHGHYLVCEPAQNLDVLAIDAFSSDAIPVHLITSEAVGIYRRHLKPGGVIAFHVTNRFLNLIPVVEALAQAHGLQVMHLPDGGLDAMATRSDWVLLTADVRFAGATGTGRSRAGNRAAPRLAAVDRRLQQPRAGVEVGTGTIGVDRNRKG
jgi:hypothetical protein